jgi:hypothetical protein
VKDTTYKKSTAPGREGKCECQGQCRFSGEAHETAACATCPTQAGNCVSKCIGGPGMKKKECLKYCVTKHLKFSLPPGRSYSEMLPKKEMLARAVECFVWKNVTCTHSPNDQTSKGWWCLQTINSKILLNCPARWSPHAARLLPDGTESFGFQSICEKDDIECIVQNCDRSATSGMCMDKLVSV